MTKLFSIDALFFPEDDIPLEMNSSTDETVNIPINGDQEYDNSYEDYINNNVMPYLDRNVCSQATIGVAVTLSLIMLSCVVFYFVMHNYYNWF